MTTVTDREASSREPRHCAISGLGRSRILVLLYLGWLCFAIVIPLMVAGLDAKNLTLLCSVAFLIVQISLHPFFSRLFRECGARLVFVAYGVVGACFLETFHMISQPFKHALLITEGMSVGQTMTNTAVDLVFTVPSYVVIFSVIWLLVKRYRFSRFEYFILVSLGQSLGDGGLVFFLEAPFMLPFLPYAMVKYQAMNFVPYLLVRDDLVPEDESWKKYVVPVMAIFATYFACGAVMNTLWAVAGLP